MTHVSQQWNRRIVAGVAATAVLGSVLLGAGTAAADEGVPIRVDVVDTGSLSMTVDTSPVTLTESGSTDELRRFAGTLPTVTVTDTRSNIPEDTWWAVVGQTDDFADATNPAKTIPGDYLGWTPALLDDPDDGTIFAGDEIESTAVDGVGLAEGFELLFYSWESGPAAEERDSWDANADLELLVPSDELEAGSYEATLTLSLFEDVITD